MRKIWMCVAMALLLGSGAAFGGLFSEDPGELAVSGVLWLPGEGDSDLFDLGYGANISYREWFRFPWGVGLNLGIAQWQVDSGSSAYKWDQLSNYNGDANLLLMGPALYFCVIDWDTWNLTLETGVQFAYIDSNVKVSLDNERLNIDIDNALFWHIGMEYEYMLAENFFIAGALGYQMDLIEAETEYSYGKLRDTHLHGAYFRLGAKLLF